MKSSKRPLRDVVEDLGRLFETLVVPLWVNAWQVDASATPQMTDFFNIVPCVLSFFCARDLRFSSLKAFFNGCVNKGGWKSYPWTVGSPLYDYHMIS